MICAVGSEMCVATVPSMGEQGGFASRFFVRVVELRRNLCSRVFSRSSSPWCSPCVCSEGSSRATDDDDHDEDDDDDGGRQLFISKREIRRKTKNTTRTLVNELFFFYIVLIG